MAEVLITPRITDGEGEIKIQLGVAPKFGPQTEVPEFEKQVNTALGERCQQCPFFQNKCPGIEANTPWASSSTNSLGQPTGVINVPGKLNETDPLPPCLGDNPVQINGMGENARLTFEIFFRNQFIMQLVPRPYTLPI